MQFSINRKPATPRPRALVIGMSHVNCVSKALKHGKYEPIALEVINLADHKAAARESFRTGKAPGVHNSDVEAVFLILNGNSHLSYALIERDPPIAVRTSEGVVPEDTSGRVEMSEAEVDAVMAEMMAGQFKRMASYIGNFGPDKVHVISTPPPIGSEAHIRANPVSWGPELYKGVAPASLRKAVWASQTRVLKAECEKLGAPFHLPPDEAFEDDGCLPEKFWQHDPSHGNADYGLRLIEMIRGILAAKAAAAG